MVQLKKRVSHKCVQWRSAEQDWQPWGQRFSLYWTNKAQKKAILEPLTTAPIVTEQLSARLWLWEWSNTDLFSLNIRSCFSFGLITPWKAGREGPKFNTWCPPVGLSSALINPSPITKVYITADHLPPASFSSFFLTLWVSVCPKMCSPTLPSLEGLMLSEKPRTAFERVLPSLFTVQYWQE